MILFGIVYRVEARWLGHFRVRVRYGMKVLKMVSELNIGGRNARIGEFGGDICVTWCLSNRLLQVKVPRLSIARKKRVLQEDTWLRPVTWREIST